MMAFVVLPSPFFSYFFLSFSIIINYPVASGSGGGGDSGPNYPGSHRQRECEDGVLLGSSGLVYISHDGIVVPTVGAATSPHSLSSALQ